MVRQQHPCQEQFDMGKKASRRASCETRMSTKQPRCLQQKVEMTGKKIGDHGIGKNPYGIHLYQSASQKKPSYGIGRMLFLFFSRDRHYRISWPSVFYFLLIFCYDAWSYFCFICPPSPFRRNFFSKSFQFLLVMGKI